MSHKKLELAKEFAKAETRIAGLRSIDEQFDLGNGLSLDNHKTALAELRSNVQAYNMLLAQADELRARCKQQLAAVRDFNNRMLSGVGTDYGKESVEYAKAGGVRPSERKKAKVARKSGNG